MYYIFHIFCLILFWWHLSCLKGLTQPHCWSQKHSLSRLYREEDAMHYNNVFMCRTVLSVRCQLKSQWTTWDKPGLVLKGWVPVHMFQRHSQDKENVCPFSESVTVSSMINILLYVRSLNIKMLILQPLLQIHPQKLTHTVCKQRSLSVCSLEHTGRLETKSNTTDSLWIPGCKENTKSQMKSDSVQIPPWQWCSQVQPGTLSAPLRRAATERQKRSEIQL